MGEDLETNIQQLREAYQLWNDTRGASVSSWMDLMSEDVVFRSLAGGSPGMDFTLDCFSKTDLQRYFHGLISSWEMISYTVEEYIGKDDRVVVLSRCAFRSRKTGKIVETPKADIFRFRNGKIVEFFEFYDTARAIGANTP